MLSAAEIERDIFDLAEQFRGHMRRKEYAQAKYCYERALTVSLFVQLEPEKCLELFGSRQQDPPVEGLFKERDVEKVRYECCVRRKKEEAAVRADAERRYGRKFAR